MKTASCPRPGSTGSSMPRPRKCPIRPRSAQGPPPSSTKSCCLLLGPPSYRAPWVRTVFIVRYRFWASRQLRLCFVVKARFVRPHGLMAGRDARPRRQSGAVMDRMFYRRLTGALGAVMLLASAGGLVILLAISGGSGLPTAQAVMTPQALGAPAAVAGSASPSPSGAPAPATEGPPPVVDGVQRTNVSSAHSPQIQHQLAGPPPTAPPPMGAGALGVDVADYQHPHGAAIDWPQVAGAGYKFAFIKATEGDYYANPYYASDLPQAKAAGLYVAGYHFAIPNVSGGASQADYALQNGAYTAGGRTLPLALDIEYNPYGPECYGLTPAAMVSWVSSFTDEARRLTGQLPISYTTADWWNTCTDDSTAFDADQLWVAAFGIDRPPLPAGWSNWTFWQYTSRGSVPGITGPVDLSYFLSAALRLADPGNQASGQPSRPPSGSASAP